jgi:hypothetical protein
LNSVWNNGYTKDNLTPFSLQSWGFIVDGDSLVKGYYEAEASGDRLVITRPRGAKGKL